MQMDFCLTLLWLFVFLESSTQVTVSQTVFLRCPKELTVVRGQNLTVRCELDTSSHHTPCQAKSSGVECKLSSETLDCSLQAPLPINKIQNLTVEIFHVTTPGNYTIFIPTNCGSNPQKERIEIKVTSSSEVSTDPNPSVITSSVIAIFAALSGLAITAVVILAIRKYLKTRPTKRVLQGKYSITEQT